MQSACQVAGAVEEGQESHSRLQGADQLRHDGDPESAKSVKVDDDDDADDDDRW